MTGWSKKAWLLLAVAAVLLLPLPGALWHWGGLPPGFGVFPPRFVQAAPGFSPAYFAFGCGVALALLTFFLRPGLFGFRPAAPAPAPALLPKPWWFHAGFAGTVLGVGLMWFGPSPVARWTFVPTWWCFIVGLDGWSWSRNGGRSLLTTRRGEFLAQTALSVPEWFVFEYLNFYAPGNWYYPHTDLLPHWGAVAWFLLAYTTVSPAVAEWYTILESVPALRGRWTDGPRLAFSRKAQWGLLLFMGGLFALFGAVPYPLFWMLWLGPMAVLSLALTLTGAWTPYRAIARGDWSKVVLIALAAVCTSVSWESWNYGSEFFRNHHPANPNFWVYDIPYMNVGHLFSEMPALGYFGYLPFGVTCWLWWLLSGQVFGVGLATDLTMQGAPGAALPAREAGRAPPLEAQVSAKAEASSS